MFVRTPADDQMPSCKLLILNGGQGRNRTADASLFRAALYRLSYLAVWLEAFSLPNERVLADSLDKRVKLIPDPRFC